jgi:hypothetical protein
LLLNSDLKYTLAAMLPRYALFALIFPSPHLCNDKPSIDIGIAVHPNPEIEIHDYAPSSHPRTLRKTIAEPTGATQILHKPLEYEHGAHSKNPISGFGVQSMQRL